MGDVPTKACEVALMDSLKNEAPKTLGDALRELESAGLAGEVRQVREKMYDSLNEFACDIMLGNWQENVFGEDTAI